MVHLKILLFEQLANSQARLITSNLFVVDIIRDYILPTLIILVRKLIFLLASHAAPKASVISKK